MAGLSNIVQQPQNPDEMARLAGKELYECSVGMLRRVELWRLGNAWGMNFPAGATKDFMLPFFKQLEAEGKNPLRPPNANLDTLVKTREVAHSEENHSETPPPEIHHPDVIQPALKTDFELKLEAARMSEIRKICAMRGIAWSTKDRKLDLIARIMAATGAV
jgi:hypothetical protein